MQLELNPDRLDHARAGVVQADPGKAVLARVDLAQRGLELDAPVAAPAPSDGNAPRERKP
jgi:hypothetical protein